MHTGPQVNWEFIARRLLILGKYGFDTSMMYGRVDDLDFLSDEWLENWFGEKIETYVQDELDVVDLLMSQKTR